MVLDKTALTRALDFFYPFLHVFNTFLKNRVVFGNLVALVAGNAWILELHHMVRGYHEWKGVVQPSHCTVVDVTVLFVLETDVDFEVTK